MGEASAAALKQALQKLLDKGDTRLILDMGRVSYIDSAVWGELALAATRARLAGGELRLCAMSGDLLAILTLTRLSRVMAVHPTQGHATVFEEKPVKNPAPGLLAHSSFRRPAVTKPLTRA